jgi:hypothetical protein
MRYLVLALVALILGAVIGLRWNEPPPPPADPINVIVTQLKTQAVIEHERQIAVWYKACPDVTGVDPLMFVAWPAKLSFELPLDNVEVRRDGTRIKVRTAGIRADEPALPTDAMDYLSTEPILNLVDEDKLVNTEIGKASGVARYLASYYLKRDATLYDDMASELQTIILRIAGAVDAGITSVEVEIPRPDPKLPDLPKLELCEGTRAAVNGLPFAKTEDGYQVRIAFRTKPDAGAAPAAADKPQAAAIVYGQHDQGRPPAPRPDIKKRPTTGR